MMRKTNVLGWMGFFGCMITSNAIFAMGIVNGAFDADLSGWHDVSNGGSVSYDPEQQKAVLVSGSGVAAGAAVLMQGDDGRFAFADAQTLTQGDAWLTFDVEFALFGRDSQETGEGLNDSFQVWLYDAHDASGKSDVSLLSLFVDDGLARQHFSLDLIAFTGRTLSLSFELNDENDGVDHRVSLDNIRIESHTHHVPLPNSLWLVLSGLLAESLRQRPFTARGRLARAVV